MTKREYNPKDFADLAEYLISGGREITKNKFHLIRSDTKEGEYVTFLKDTEELTRIPAETIRMAARFVTKMTEDVPHASVTVSTDGEYEVGVTNWHEGLDVRVVLRKYNSLVPLESWELEETTAVWLGSWELKNWRMY